LSAYRLRSCNERRDRQQQPFLFAIATSPGNRAMCLAVGRIAHLDGGEFLAFAQEDSRLDLNEQLGERTPPPWRCLEYLRGIELPDAALTSNVEHGAVEQTVGRDESCVPQELAPGRKVER